MGVFDRIERKLEGAVVGVFAKAFKGDVQPIEIAARLQRELDSEAKLLSRTSKLVPNDFTIGLSQHDHDRLAPYSKKLSAEIVPELTSHASEHGYVFNGPISIHLELDESLSTGRFTVSSLAMEPREPTESEMDTQIRTRLVLEVNGMRHPLTPPGVTIGRGSEADVRINDPGISRKHAEIQIAGNGEELMMQIVDLGSTNGITVNGQKVRRAAIEDGTRIEIGRTRMLVHDPSTRS
jgi:hypothetical protein